MVLAAAASASASTYHANDVASLQSALASANAAQGPSTIDLAGGVYLPTSTLSIERDVTIVGPVSGRAVKLAGTSVEPFPSSLMRVEAGAELTLTDVELAGGGGEGTTAAIDDYGTLDLDSSTVAGSSGPGLLVEVHASASAVNSTLSDGSGFAVVDNGNVSLASTTIAFNTGGGIYDSEGALTLVNTIVAENGSRDCTRRASMSDHSLDSDGSCGVGALADRNPLLDPGLLANGGATPTHALEEGSPAIDAGDESVCPAEDERHYLRSGGRCDVGAYQSAAAPAPSGRGAAPVGGGGGADLVKVSAHGTLRGAHRPRITFSLRASAGRTAASFSYRDGRRHVILESLRVSSLTVDWARGTATLRGTCVQSSTRRRVRVAVVLVSHDGRRSLRIRLSTGYYTSATLLSGSILLAQSPT